MLLDGLWIELSLYLLNSAIGNPLPFDAITILSPFIANPDFEYCKTNDEFSSPLATYLIVSSKYSSLCFEAVFTNDSAASSSRLLITLTR